MEDLIIAPEQYTNEGYMLIQLTCSGFIWLFVIADHMENFPHKNSFLSPEGRFGIYKKNVLDIKHIREFAFEIYKQGKTKI